MIHLMVNVKRQIYSGLQFNISETILKDFYVIGFKPQYNLIISESPPISYIAF